MTAWSGPRSSRGPAPGSRSRWSRPSRSGCPERWPARSWRPAGAPVPWCCSGSGWPPSSWSRSGSCHCGASGRCCSRNAGLIVTYGLLAVAGAQFCYFSAVKYMQVGPALLIEYTAPAAVVVWLWLRHSQRPGPVTLVGAGVAGLGLVLVLDLMSGADLSVPGVLWALAAMVGAATLLRHLRRREQRPPADGPGGRGTARGSGGARPCWAWSASCRWRPRRSR